MTVTTATESAANTEVTEAAAPVFEKGTWQHTLQLSVQADDKSKSAKILAGKRLRAGAWSAIGAFLADPGADADALYQEVKSTGLSASTASKIKKVAVTARDFPEFGWSEVPLGASASFVPLVSDPKMSLNKADALARKLTDTPAVEAAEDSAFESVIAEVAEAAPKTSTTVEGMLQIALTKAGDADEFVKVLIDVLSGPTGIHNADACQAFIRAFATENGARIKASKPEKVATVKAAPTVKTKAAPVKAAPVKGKPAPVKAASTEPTEEDAPVESTPAQPEDFDWDDIETGDDTASVEETVAPVKAKPAPVKAKPVKATPIRKA